jgi:alpha-tubulin suppressor-like RCC1 family protein
VSALTDVVDVTAGHNYCLVLKSDGTVWGWGLNYHYGSLGDGTFNIYPFGTIVQAKGLTDVVAIDAGMRHSLALKSDGSVWAWGLDSSTQLGDGSTSNSNTPARVIGLRDVVAISGGEHHTLALKTDGTVWACGQNSDGQLGNGTFSFSQFTRSFAHQVSNLTDVVAIAAGSAHSLALKADGTVWAWGDNSKGQLGNETNDNSNIPVQVSGLTNVSAIAAGGLQSLALVENEPAPATTEPASVLTTTPVSSPSSPAPTSTVTTSPALTTAHSSISTPASSTPVAGSPGEEQNNGWWVWLVSGVAVASVVAILIIRFRTRISKFF